MTWTGFFLTGQKIQLVIDEYDNNKREIVTGIPSGSPVSPILFLIYISGVSNKVSETSPLIISLFFVHDLGFIALGSLVKKVVKTLEKAAKAVLKWERLNAVIYDTSKTEAVLFFKIALATAKQTASRSKNQGW